MNKTFPKDCAGCPHFKMWDLSVDDYVYFCDILKTQVDACDEDFCHIKCPLK